MKSNSSVVSENFKNYFVAVFDKSSEYSAAAGNGEILPDKLECEEEHAGRTIGFSTRRGELVHARIASSFK